MRLWEDIVGSLDGGSTDLNLDDAEAISRALHSDLAMERAGRRVVGPECIIVSEPGPLRQELSELDGRGTFLDETIHLRDPEGEAFVAMILEEIANVEQRKRQRRPQDAVDHCNRVRSAMANGLRCYWHRDPRSVSFYTKSDAYQKIGGKPRWMRGRALRELVTLMEIAGLVESKEGRRDIASRFMLTPKALAYADAAGVTPKTLKRRVPRDRLVRLNGVKPKKGFDAFTKKTITHKAEQIAFDQTTETEIWTSKIAAYNDFLDKQDIGLAAPESCVSAWVTALNDGEGHAGAKVRRPEILQTDVYRVFNNASWRQGGRLYGGWWINTPKSVRSHILINGQPTAELDFAACHPSMLYHELGLECEGEIYEIPAITAYEESKGLPRGTYKDCIKWLTQVLLNGKGRPSQTSRNNNAEPPPGFTDQEITDMIIDRHRPIATAFKTQAGLRLMRLDSDIALEVVTRAMEEGWIALPVHDSFIAVKDKEYRLRQIMVEEYNKKLNADPLIKNN